MSENKDETKQGKDIPFSPNNRNILPLLISGYRFNNDWNNFLLNTCCGIPWENLCIGKLMMDVFAPKQNSNTDMKIADNNFSLPPLPVEAHDFDEKKHTPLLLGSVFFKGQNNLLYSKQKAGKSKLSMEVAKSQLIRRPRLSCAKTTTTGKLMITGVSSVKKLSLLTFKNGKMLRKTFKHKKPALPIGKLSCNTQTLNIEIFSASHGRF